MTLTDGTYSTFALIKNDPKQGFVLSGINVKQGETAKLTYKTSYKVEDTGKIGQNASYGNAATIDWASNNQPYTVTQTKTYTPDVMTVNNGRKSGSFNYATQQLQWKVDEMNVPLNYSKMVQGTTITNTFIEPVVTPTLPQRPSYALSTIDEIEQFLEQYDSFTLSERAEMDQFVNVAALRVKLQQLKQSSEDKIMTEKDEVTKTQHPKLPQTDGKSNVSLVIVGFIFMVISVYVFVRRRAVK